MKPSSKTKRFQTEATPACLPSFTCLPFYHLSSFQAVTCSSWTSFASNSLLSFLLAPIMGTLSDRHGRKPFMLLGMTLTMAPILVLLAHIKYGLSIYLLFLANALAAGEREALLGHTHLPRPSAVSIGSLSPGRLGGLPRRLRSAFVCVPKAPATT